MQQIEMKIHFSPCVCHLLDVLVHVTYPDGNLQNQSQARFLTAHVLQTKNCLEGWSFPRANQELNYAEKLAL